MEEEEEAVEIEAVVKEEDEEEEGVVEENEEKGEEKEVKMEEEFKAGEGGRDTSGSYACLPTSHTGKRTPFLASGNLAGLPRSRTLWQNTYQF